MPTDQQISILVDIASNGGVGLPPERSNDLIEMVVANFVEREKGKRGGYKLTVKGQRLLGERGVGANES